jgi:hypothetical protein
VDEAQAVTAKAGEDDKEWCNRGCGYHWRVEISGSQNAVIILQFDGSCGQAYLSADEADAIGSALKEHASRVRNRSLVDHSVTSATFEEHDCAPREPRTQTAANAAAYRTRGKS